MLLSLLACPFLTSKFNIGKCKIYIVLYNKDVPKYTFIVRESCYYVARWEFFDGWALYKYCTGKG